MTLPEDGETTLTNGQKTPTGGQSKTNTDKEQADLLGTKNVSDPTLNDSLDCKNPSKFKVLPTYDEGFTKHGRVTTITELVTAREALQTD